MTEAKSTKRLSAMAARDVSFQVTILTVEPTWLNKLMVSLSTPSTTILFKFIISAHVQAEEIVDKSDGKINSYRPLPLKAEPFRVVTLDGKIRSFNEEQPLKLFSPI